METHESYVSLEVAKLLKQTGFNWECTHYYSVNILHEPNNGFIHIYKQYKALFYDHNRTKMPVYSAPSLDVAQRWLREVKNIDINVLAESISYHKQYLVSIWFNISSRSAYDNIILDNRYATYEEAQEAGIKKALELILEEKK